MLDPRFVEGHGPLEGDYWVEGYAPGLERAYVRIPKTIVGQIEGDVTEQNQVTAIEVRSSSSLLVAHLYEGVTGSILSPTQPSAAGIARVFAHFNFDLVPLSFGTSTVYDRVAEKLSDEGLREVHDLVSYFDQFKNEIRYWDGETWQDKPVQNRRYVEAVAALDAGSE